LTLFLVRHGLTNITELTGFIFSSNYDTFEEAFEFLIFGRLIDKNVPDWILRNVLISAILNGKNPDFRGISKHACQEYINYELISKNIQRLSEFPYYQGTKWIKKINHYIRITDVTLHECEPFGTERGIYFTVGSTKYVFIPDSCELKIYI
jgi:hypothetical protein